MTFVTSNYDNSYDGSLTSGIDLIRIKYLQWIISDRSDRVATSSELDSSISQNKYKKRVEGGFQLFNCTRK